MKKISLAIIQYDGYLLLGQVRQERLREFGDLPYIFPGGKVEEGESEADAAVREAREETTLTVEVVAEIGFRVHPVTRKEVHYFHCTPYNGSNGRKGQIRTIAPPNDAVRKWTWIPFEELGKYAPTLSPEVRDYFRL